MSQIIELTLKKLKKIGLEHEIPNITEQNAAFLKKLIFERQPKHMLEIGTANGYSTLHFASVLVEKVTLWPSSKRGICILLLWKI